ncbi:ATP synthase F0 subunit B [Limisalsivibrio acetivorans]|uniref:F0F1 ATP synthase subunit B family protein n=1 Tax=Limisalsivibrio acetivorans TaxID=1304888 RepID=UPI0003B47096|nr:ATP synthase F0 subunit B [Limisalsivibrio acetivorans]
MVYVDFTVVIQIVQFLLIVFLAKKMIIDPTIATVEKRDSKVSSLVGEAESLRAKVEKSKAEYTEKMNEMRAELAEHHRKIREEASKEAAERIEQAKKEVDAKIASAAEELEAEKSKAKEQVDGMVAELSELIVDKVLKSA